MSQRKLSICKSHWKVWAKRRAQLKVCIKAVTETMPILKIGERRPLLCAVVVFRCLCSLQTQTSFIASAAATSWHLSECPLSVLCFKGYSNSLLKSLVLIGLYSPRLWNEGLNLSFTEVSEPEMNRISFGLTPNFTVEGNGNLNVFHGLFTLSEQ